MQRVGVDGVNFLEKVLHLNHINMGIGLQSWLLEDTQANQLAEKQNNQTFKQIKFTYPPSQHEYALR